MQKKTGVKLILLIIIAAIVFIVIYGIYNYKKYHPSVINEGDNYYLLDDYDINENGMTAIEEIIDKTEGIGDIQDISYFVVKLDSKGLLDEFTLILQVFDKNENYIGDASYQYKKSILTYNKPKNSNLQIAYKHYDTNTITSFNNYLKAIPLKDLSSGESKTLVYEKDSVVDCNDKNLVVSPDNFCSSNVNNYYVAIKINETYVYVFVDEENEQRNNPGFMMDTDYYINETLRFTRDYGRTWIYANVDEDDLDKTLAFYRSNSLPVNSWFMSLNEKLPIAFFYGEDPILKLTLDNGKTWQNVYFPTSEDIGRPIIYRVIGFVDENFGYAALGTDWSMGGGEWKQLYVTSDKGKTWNKLPTPFNGTSSKLVDFYMYDQNAGLLMLENRENESFPLAYVTTDGGKNWQEVDYPILEDTQYIVNIESITFDGKSYYIKFGQGNYDILKIIYKTDKLDSRWDFVNVTEENIHTVG